MKRKNYELELPEGYKVAKVIDAKNVKIGLIMNIIALLLAAAIMVPIVLIWLRKYQDIHINQTEMFKVLIAMVTMFLILVIHELLHGLAYKIMTHQKLTFGLTLTVAFCGVPQIYVYRRCAIISMLTPLVVISIALLIPLFLVDDFFIRVGILFVFAFHFGGCVGDIYGALLFAFKFKDKETLMNDTGPKQTFYVKEK